MDEDHLILGVDDTEMCFVLVSRITVGLTQVG